MNSMVKERGYGKQNIVDLLSAVYFKWLFTIRFREDIRSVEG